MVLKCTGDGTMEDRGVKKCQSAILTPTEGNKFKFPPEAFSSADRLRDISNLYNLGLNMRRSFTPIRGSLYIKSPDISPIEFNQNLDYNFKRLPKEKIQKAVADTTVPSEDDSISVPSEDFTLMPPPRRRPSGSGSANNNLESLARQRRIDHNYQIYNRIIKMSARRAAKKPSQPRAPPRNEMLNAHISLESLLKDTGLERYIEVFEKEEIELDSFLLMGDDDLKRIGIDSAHDREIILKFKNLF